MDRNSGCWVDETEGEQRGHRSRHQAGPGGDEVDDDSPGLIIMPDKLGRLFSHYTVKAVDGSFPCHTQHIASNDVMNCFAYKYTNYNAVIHCYYICSSTTDSALKLI